MGALDVTITSVRAITDGGRTDYELHGSVHGQLIPTVEGTASGWIDLRATF